MINKENDDLNQARYAILRAAREISRWRPEPDRGLQYLQPYLGIDSFEDVQRIRSDTLVSHISAVVADCHREKGNYALAAQWYERASSFSDSCFFADFYVDMVIKHRIKDHYAQALFCKERAEAHWKSKPRLLRGYLYICGFCMQLEYPWNIIKMVSIKWRARNSKKYLSQLMKDKD